MENDAVIKMEVMEDSDGNWCLYIVPKDEEICLTEADLRAALTQIENSSGWKTARK